MTLAQAQQVKLGDEVVLESPFSMIGVVTAIKTDGIAAPYFRVVVLVGSERGQRLVSYRLCTLAR